MNKQWRDILLFGGAGLAAIDAMVLAFDFIDGNSESGNSSELANAASGDPLFAMVFGLGAVAVSYLWR